jgi:hypothetical protein
VVRAICTATASPSFPPPHRGLVRPDASHPLLRKRIYPVGMSALPPGPIVTAASVPAASAPVDPLHALQAALQAPAGTAAQAAQLAGSHSSLGRSSGASSGRARTRSFAVGSSTSLRLASPAHRWQLSRAYSVCCTYVIPE